MFKRLDLTDHTGRVFVVGDIHGAFTKLEEALSGLGFDWSTDILLSVGDLVDRGPESHLAVDWLERENFHAVKGNHEQMCLEAGGTSWHEGNGGRWWKKLKYSHSKRPQIDFIRAFKALPLLMEVLLPSGKKIGLAHACYYLNDWNLAELTANTPNAGEQLMWDRSFITLARQHQAFFPLDGVPRIQDIKNVDHVYYGHTPIDEPLTVGNQSWIDTGAVFGDGKFTIVELC